MTSLWPAGEKPEFCVGCPHGRKKQPFVPGYGKLTGRVIVIGEKPGACESGTCGCLRGAHVRLRPFVGKSGKRIDVGLGDREDVFITNVRKCNAYDKDKDERAQSIAHCVQTFLQPEMDAIDKAQREAGIKTGGVIGIGADAAAVLVGKGNMSKLHGTVYTRKERDAMIEVGMGEEEYDA